MKSKSTIYFESASLGKCKVICIAEDIALIYLENNYEHYVVAFGIDIAKKKWQFGSYYNELPDALEVFNEVIKSTEL